jgi:hypothetical protein
VRGSTSVIRRTLACRSPATWPTPVRVTVDARSETSVLRQGSRALSSATDRGLKWPLRRDLRCTNGDRTTVVTRENRVKDTRTRYRSNGDVRTPSRSSDARRRPAHTMTRRGWMVLAAASTTIAVGMSTGQGLVLGAGLLLAALGLHLINRSDRTGRKPEARTLSRVRHRRRVADAHSSKPRRTMPGSPPHPSTRRSRHLYDVSTAFVVGGEGSLLGVSDTSLSATAKKMHARRAKRRLITGQTRQPSSLDRMRDSVRTSSRPTAAVRSATTCPRTGLTRDLAQRRSGSGCSSRT